MHTTHFCTSFYVILSLVFIDGVTDGEDIAMSTNRVTTKLMSVSRLPWPGSKAGSLLADVQFVTEAPVSRACPSAHSLNGLLVHFL